VYKFDPTGKLLGQKGTSPKNVILKTPTGITVAADGSVYVSDTGLQGVVNMGTTIP
jgi:streptogramin lyase